MVVKCVVTIRSECTESKHGADSREGKSYLNTSKVSNRCLAAGTVSVTFAHDFFLGVGLLIQDAQLIIAVYEHDARVIPVFHSPLILLHTIK